MSNVDNVTDINEARESNAGTRPNATFTGTGGLSVSVWKKRTDGQNFDSYSIRIERTYKDDKSGEFKTTQYLRDSDLLRAAKLIEDADLWIEKDKGKNKGMNSARSLS